MRGRRLTDQERWLRDKAESEFQGEILKAARLLGWTHYHTRDSRRSPSGFPDLVLVKPPRLIFAELKRDGRQLEPEQLVWYGLLSQCPGAEMYAWRPSDMDRVLEILGNGAMNRPEATREKQEETRGE